jgi:hypothetical protein
MRKLLPAFLGLLAFSGALIAQGHDDATEKKVSDLVIVVSDARVGGDLLAAGEYRVVCDTKKITFIRTSDGKRILERACKGRELPKPAENTVMSTNVDKGGVRFVKTLLLRGSSIEHVFE